VVNIITMAQAAAAAVVDTTAAAPEARIYPATAGAAAEVADKVLQAQ
jgi:hypothetical protein